MDELHVPLQQLLFRLASRFRSGILRCNRLSLSLPTLRDFPRGACGDASLLLGKYLQVQRCGLAHYVLGERAGLPHAWLQLHGFIVDITADQFEDQSASVIVSTDSSWHRSFNGKMHSPADFCLYDRETVFKLTNAYQEISSLLDD
jgi:hypothetical protein